MTRLYMTFVGCTNLISLTLPSDWNTANVTDFDGTFKNCSSLVLDCSDWNVASAKDRADFSTGAPGVIEPAWVS